MKQRSGKKVEEAARMLLQTLSRNHEDVGIILDEFEGTHDDYEKCQSRDYQALGAGHYALQQGIERMNRILNK